MKARHIWRYSVSSPNYSVWCLSGWQEDLKHWSEGRSSASRFFPTALYFAQVFLPTLIFLSPWLTPILDLGVPQNNLGTLGPSKDGERGHKSWKFTASWQAFCCRKSLSLLPPLSSVFEHAVVSPEQTPGYLGVGITVKFSSFHS